MSPDSPDPGYLKLLVEFGYPHNFAVEALQAVRNASLESALEWLEGHRSELEDRQLSATVDRPTFSFAAAPPASLGNAAQAPAPAIDLLSSDIRPDGLSRSKLEAERKAHQEYTRQKKMQEERALLKKKEETARLVREKYAQEKAARLNARNQLHKEEVAPHRTTPDVRTGSSAPSNKNLSEAPVVVQVRIPNRPPMTIQGLLGNANLAELYARVDQEMGRNDYVLTMPFPPPPTHFDRSDPRSLAEAGLCPRAALTVTDLASLGKVSEGHGGIPTAAAIAPLMGAFGDDAVAGIAGNGHALGGNPLMAATEREHPPDFEAQCRICQSQIDAGERTKVIPGCGHIFHGECIEEWVQEHNTCPAC